MTTTTITEVTAPTAWVGCLSCYNEGRLVGDWHDAIVADEVTVATVHKGLSPHLWRDHEEMWVFDHENIPVQDEFSPRTAALWGRLLDDVPEHHRKPLAAWVRSGDFIADSDGLPCLDDFEDKYRGEWPSFVAYIEELADDIGLLTDVSEELRGYFDFDRYARDCQYDYSIYDAPQGGVYVFTN